MKSLNFEFLRPKHSALADLGSFAEAYTHSDPSSALVKLRLFGENLVADYFQHFGLLRPPRPTFLDYLESDTFRGTVPGIILSKLHALRTQGNRAAHGNGSLRPEIAAWILKESFDLAKWFALSLGLCNDVQQRVFQAPPRQDTDQKSALKGEARFALRKLAAQEAQMQQLLAELEQARAQASSAEKTLQEQQALLAKNAQAVDVLQFSEAKTRKLLIDQLLAQAGWNVGAEGASTVEVGQEVEVTDMPTDTGKGYVDYVLYDDHEAPLAVIEAKKTAHDAEKGRVQARLYAQALEDRHGRRPIIFYTNGYDIYISDDAKAECPRRLYGFYSKDSLEYCLWQTTQRKPLNAIETRREIVDRLYQMETIRRVTEKFEDKRRKALLVLATGTGKTRVAVALSRLLLDACWVKRILFLCDRRELRKQANNAFAQFIDSEPRTYVSNRTNNDRLKTIYLSTYPAMLQCFQNFDVGFFDLIIADESHRSIYNRYRDLFEYFDAYQVGLTATPVTKIARNTYKMFGCDDQNPTAHFSYNEAIEHRPPYLVPFKVTTHTTKFLREGISYATMSDEQKAELDEQVEESESVDFTREQVSKDVFNKDTDRKILRNLMENGDRVHEGSRLGKTILFARNHEHASQLQHLFDEMYPQYMKPKQEFCAVIDNYVDYAEQLIDDFKGQGQNNNLSIAISVDMLDTGIDVPEVVNLVFAKPVKSYVKFWQMIGRGTRLCPNLLGPGQDKDSFRIFDHWGNFEYFGENPPEYEPAPQKSLLQKLFEARIALTEKAILQQSLPAFELGIELLEKDVRALDDRTIAVRERWRDVRTVLQRGCLMQWSASTLSLLRNAIAPLMQWRALEAHEEAYRFDLLVARLQKARLEESSDFDDLKAEVQANVSQLPITLSQVQAKEIWLKQVKSPQFWQDIPIETLEKLRRELRGIMHCRTLEKVLKPKPLLIDVRDAAEETDEYVVKLEGLDLAAYRHRVEQVLKTLFDESPALQKIKARQPVTAEELMDLVRKVTLRDPDLKVDDLLVHYPNSANRLDLAIRQIIGLDAEAVNTHFTRFVQKYPGLNAHQIRFLELIKKHIVNYGALQIDKLWDLPFTQLHSLGVDGVFTDGQQVDDLLTLIQKINELAPASEESN